MCAPLVSRTGGDYQAIHVQEYKPGFYEFDLKEWDQKETGHIRLGVPGYHNVYNAPYDVRSVPLRWV